jgi:hypothetical protein
MLFHQHHSMYIVIKVSSSRLLSCVHPAGYICLSGYNPQGIVIAHVPHTGRIFWNAKWRSTSRKCQQALQEIHLPTETVVKEDKMNNVPHSSQVYTFIANYSQNLDLPHFGGEHPGEKIYYTPLNIFQFGVVDPTDNDKLHAFLYEGEMGRRGGTMLLH